MGPYGPDYTPGCNRRPDKLVGTVPNQFAILVHFVYGEKRSDSEQLAG